MYNTHAARMWHTSTKPGQCTDLDATEGSKHKEERRSQVYQVEQEVLLPMLLWHNDHIVRSGDRAAAAVQLRLLPVAHHLHAAQRLESTSSPRTRGVLPVPPVPFGACTVASLGRVHSGTDATALSGRPWRKRTEADGSLRVSPNGASCRRNTYMIVDIRCFQVLFWAPQFHAAGPVATQRRPASIVPSASCALPGRPATVRALDLACLHCW